MKTKNDTLNAIQTMVNSAIEQAGYDKTRNAVIIARNSNNTYNIKMDGIEYDNVVFYGSGEVQVNEVVKVVIPNNQASQMYIMGKGNNTSEIWTILDEIWTILDNILGKLGVDYVVEEGTSGGWKYRKWSNGFAECWGHFEDPNHTTTASGNLHYYGTGSARPYPFTFKTIPYEICNAVLPEYSAAGGGNIVGTKTRNTTTASGVYNIYRPSSSTTNVTVALDIYVFGEI